MPPSLADLIENRIMLRRRISDFISLQELSMVKDGSY